MKTIAILILALFISSAIAQDTGDLRMIDSTTVQVVGGITIVGDPFPISAAKINTNTLVLSNLFNIVAAISINTNYVQNSQRVQTYSTNFAYWATSNYLARVAGIYDWRVNGGNDGGNPPFDIPISLVGSYTGTNAWFALTNGFQTTNMISVSAISTHTNPISSLALVNPGSASLFTVDKWALLGKVNNLFGQHISFDTPVNSFDAATKGYVDGSLANLTGYFVTSQDSNNVLHTTMKVSGQSILDVPATSVYVPIISTSLDSTGTNFLIGVASTNLTAGWIMQTSTNLVQFYGWTVTTNYTTNIVSGVTTFTIPINFNLTNGVFFRILASSSIGFTVIPPCTVQAGVIYPSNTWTLASITNGMPNFSFWQGNSNGLALVSLYLSNGVVRIKQLAP